MQAAKTVDMHVDPCMPMPELNEKELIWNGKITL
jgi:hypothetical protein